MKRREKKQESLICLADKKGKTIMLRACGATGEDGARSFSYHNQLIFFLLILLRWLHFTQHIIKSIVLDTVLGSVSGTQPAAVVVVALISFLIFLICWFYCWLLYSCFCCCLVRRSPAPFTWLVTHGLNWLTDWMLWRRWTGKRSRCCGMVWFHWIFCIF